MEKFDLNCVPPTRLLAVLHGGERRADNEYKAIWV